MSYICYYCHRLVKPPFSYHSNGDCEEAYKMSLKSLDVLGDGISSIELLSVSGNDMDVVNAARVSRNKHKEGPPDEADKKLIRFLLNNDPQHTSPCEHNQIRFRVKLPIFVVREWHRHRIGWSYNEVSGRYVEFGKDFPMQYYQPLIWRTQSKINRQASDADFVDEECERTYIYAMQGSLQAYEKLIASGVARELARMVLPLALYTEMYATCNLVSLFHFLSLRLHKDAQQEIRQYAECMMELVEPHFPITFSAWRATKPNNPLIFSKGQLDANPPTLSTSAKS